MLSYFPAHMVQVFFIVILLSAFACSQNESNPLPRGDQPLQILSEITSIQDSARRIRVADSLWSTWVESEQIPFVRDSQVVFLYRGEAETVYWNGDFNSWSNDPSFYNTGKKISGTNIWYLNAHFPSDARLDYKIVVDGEWITDPVNPRIQWSGHGPNSELAMPDWNPERWTQSDPEVRKGSLSELHTIRSAELGYDVGYKVYLPADYESLKTLPVMYVTDGHEYLEPRLGAMVRVTDNMIHRKHIEPVILVFVYPVAPDDPEINRRADEFALNRAYLNFYAKELIPKIDRSYAVRTGAESRGIMGTSLGGLNATYFAFERPDLFGMAAIQSPAYWYRRQIFDLVDNFKGSKPLLFMSTGTIGDGTQDAREMLSHFRKNNNELLYLEVPEGHSWGAWRSQTDDILIHFFGK